MFADAIKFTSSTGGAGALTISRLLGFPMPADVFGSSGSKIVEYEIGEYTDATQTTLARYEMGIGLLNLATGSLARSAVLKTWDGASYNASNPAALAFGATASNIAIMLGASSVNTKSGLTATLSPAVSGGGNDVWQPFDTRVTYDNNSSTFPLSANAKLYVPVEYIYTKAVSQVAVDVTTAGVAGSMMRMGLYDVDPVTGGPANLISEFTTAAQIDVTATGFRAVTMAAPVWTPPGIYWLCMIASAAVTIRRLAHYGHSLLSSASASRDILFYDKSAPYGPLPAVAETVLGTGHTRSEGGKVMGMYK